MVCFHDVHEMLRNRHSDVHGSNTTIQPLARSHPTHLSPPHQTLNQVPSPPSPPITPSPPSPKYGTPTPPGSPEPLGPSQQEGAINFAVYSGGATSVALVLHDEETGSNEEIPMNKTGDAFQHF